MKKNIFYAFVALILLWSCQPQSVEKVNEEVDVETPTGYFGEEINDSGVVSLSQLVSELHSNDEFEGKVVGEIKEVCAMKGCWMTIDLPNGQTMRVTFKDYGFFVPKNSKGYPVVIEGVASKKETDVATLRHYAEDAGKSKEEIESITEPKQEYAFEAVGVIIRDDA
ncbi:DUF4920 domain-containing protein [Aquiflexum lacus]|uniref:DUF4920 domain-containing protein n=1 Tax=Aquiflexum lacus TaxID=2483805 RepID=UPI0018951C5E|nr:DUF4920 domain-containing protein [Aquiflexum lacus]